PRQSVKLSRREDSTSSTAALRCRSCKSAPTPPKPIPQGSLATPTVHSSSVAKPARRRPRTPPTPLPPNRSVASRPASTSPGQPLPMYKLSSQFFDELLVPCLAAKQSSKIPQPPPSR